MNPGPHDHSSNGSKGMMIGEEDASSKKVSASAKI